MYSYFEAHVGWVNHAEKVGQQIGSDVEDGEECDDCCDAQEDFGGFDAGFCFYLLEEFVLFEVVVDVAEHCFGQGLHLV